MSNPKNLSSLAIVLLLINLNTNVNSEMRKSWSRKTVLNETSKADPLTSKDIMKYFRAEENSDFESVFSDKSQLTTETIDKSVEVTTLENIPSEDFVNDESAEKAVVAQDETKTDVKEELSEEKTEKETKERRNMTKEERDVIRQGLNLIVLGKIFLLNFLSFDKKKIFYPPRSWQKEQLG